MQVKLIVDFIKLLLFVSLLRHSLRAKNVHTSYLYAKKKTKKRKRSKKQTNKNKGSLLQNSQLSDFC